MIKRIKAEKTALYIVAMAFLAIFIKFYEPGLGNSSTGYGSLARNLSKDHRYFHLHMAPGIFDPYVDHPPLGIWLDSIIFNLFGASAQTIRLLASLAGLLIFVILFATARRVFDEKVAAWSAIALLTVNVFMNYTSSGWLDMPMIGFVWCGIYFLFRALNSISKSKNNLPMFYVSGLFFGSAVLTKGVCALGIFPPILFLFFQNIRNKKWSQFLVVSLGTLTPILIFTYSHYQSEHFIFWQKYLFREAVEQNEIKTQVIARPEYFWHFIKTLQFGHVVAVLGLIGCYQLYRKKKTDWALFILGGMLIHNLGYSWSSRHYSQYVIPVFPFLAMGCGFTLSQIFKNVSPERVARNAFVLTLLVFVAVDVLPIRVHSGNENPYRSFMPTLRMMKDNGHMYFIGDIKDQSTWEDPASYITWYTGRTALITNYPMLLQKLSKEDPEALAVVDTDFIKKYPEMLIAKKNIIICMQNDLLTILAQTKVCNDEVRAYRFREAARGSTESAP